MLAAYAAGFAIAHWMAAAWGGAGFYSVWYPAAGLRLALLWYAGAGLTPFVALAEIMVDIAKGIFSFRTPDWPIVLFGIVRPVFAYGATVGAIRWLVSGSRATILISPMPFGLAAVAAPNVAALSALPEALVCPDMTRVQSVHEVITSLSAFAVGDLLGVLILAPPLLWMAELLTRRRPGMRIGTKMRWPDLAESSILLLGGIAITDALRRVGLGAQPMPVIFAVAWIGLRFGRAAAWVALAIVTLLMLPQTAQDMTTAARLQLHLGLATVVVVGYLAGSFADAQRQARIDVERRDRMLFQAERLKTLRAMSVAVIHEISQPLSTLAIEARHLRSITGISDPEIAESAALIDRKAATLSNLVRRLRRYGGRAVDEPTPLPVSVLIESVAALAAPEAKSEGVTLKVDPVDPDLVVLAQEVELAQAVVNLLRNAIQGAGDAQVRLAAVRKDNRVQIIVSNRHGADMPPNGGMGVGTLVARAIVEAHGGTLSRDIFAHGDVQATISLPVVGELA
ncbi:two-component oxygen-sensor histidine kinase FixL [Sphingobium fuliginis]|uniref:Two-component oxygen-sensor histidine kinase FixL n=1 Tax=Sphingobium fuliginis (strain ATCC 27551) TaxID=336203 RepID=A0A292ZDN9_SPHSA|nr:two-component oxygen-sensor histidine kinase FixL [Sphingobium fuliginis]